MMCQSRRQRHQHLQKEISHHFFTIINNDVHTSLNGDTSIVHMTTNVSEDLGLQP